MTTLTEDLTRGVPRQRLLHEVVRRRRQALALAEEVVSGIHNEFPEDFGEIVASVAIGTPIHPVDDSAVLIDYLAVIPELTDATRDGYDATRSVSELVTYGLSDGDFYTIDHALLDEAFEMVNEICRDLARLQIDN